VLLPEVEPALTAAEFAIEGRLPLMTWGSQQDVRLPALDGITPRSSGRPPASGRPRHA
jgi:hypothetical protein